MKIHYYHQFFAGPESPGPAQPRKLVKTLAERGNQVDIIACDLNAYNEQAEPVEEWAAGAGGGQVTVHRLPVPRKLRASLVNRLKTYTLFAWRAYKFGKKLPRPDLIMSSIQPLFGGYAGFKRAKKWGCPFLLEVRDIWPDALVVKKAIAPWQAAPLEKMAHSLYFGSDRIVSLTPGLKLELLKKGVPSEKIDLYPNSYDEDIYHCDEQSRKNLRRKFGWDDKFVAVYTGVHSEVTAVEVMVKTADKLRHRDDIRIDLFGSGQSKDKARALAEELGLNNIHFHDAVPKSAIPDILAAADAGLMTLFKSPLIHIYFENKFIDYMGSRLPILAAMGGVQAELIRNAGAGQVVDSFDHDGLAEIVIDAADNREKYKKMGEAGHRFISGQLSQRYTLTKYAETLEDLAAGKISERPPYDPFSELLPEGFYSAGAYFAGAKSAGVRRLTG